MALKLAIVTPEADVLSVDCDEVIVPAVNGEIGFLPGHVPVVTAIRPGVLTLLKGGKRSYYAVSTGFAEIAEDQVSILTDSSEESAAIDVARAKKSLTDAEEKLKTLSPDDPAYVEMHRRADRANARIDAASRR
ncbi:F0F1 ATP synthase subunit epsilon [Myxococcota bacterium]|nr:F0F1 ATP synthase subunit epsilon [Myxococcota bacterium]